MCPVWHNILANEANTPGLSPSHTARDRSHMTGCTWQVARDRSHVTCYSWNAHIFALAESVAEYLVSDQISIRGISKFSHRNGPSICCRITDLILINGSFLSLPEYGLIRLMRLDLNLWYKLSCLFFRLIHHTGTLVFILFCLSRSCFMLFLQMCILTKFFVGVMRCITCVVIFFWRFSNIPLFPLPFPNPLSSTFLFTYF